MIAERDRVNARFQQLAIDLLADAETAGRVLAIGDHQIELPLADQVGHALIHDGAPTAADNVADEENAHGQNLKITAWRADIMSKGGIAQRCTVALRQIRRLEWHRHQQPAEGRYAR